MMAKWIVAVSFLVVGNSGHGEIVFDVTCTDGGCLTGGWISNRVRDGKTTSVQCLDNNCTYHGWYESDGSGEPTRQAECHPGGCLEGGWNTVDRTSGELLARTTCLPGKDGKRKCHVAGWVTNEIMGERLVNNCVNDDCAANGWRIFSPKGKWQEAICKPGGCFESGWTVQQN
jgi:hypothetical protein